MSDSLLGDAQAAEEPKGDETPKAEANGKLTEAPGWTTQLPSDMREDTYFHQFGRFQDFLAAHVRMRDAQGIIPDKTDGYEFSADDIPEGMQRDEAFEKRIRELAHRAKLTNSQAREIYRDQMSLAQEQIGAYRQNAEKAKEEGKAALVRQHGEDGFRAGNFQVSRFLNTFDATGELREALDRAGLGNDPAVWNAMKNAGAQLVGDSTPPDSSSPGGEPDPRLGRYKENGTMMQRLRARQAARG